MNNIEQIITNNNIIPKWFITIKYKETKSFVLGDRKSNIKADNTNLTKVETATNYFINLLYQYAYNKSSTNKINDTKFQILSFLELGQAKYGYHAHLVVENILEMNIDEIKQILSRIKIKHSGIRTNDVNAIDIRPYKSHHAGYVDKQSTPIYFPLSTKTSRIN
jgi:phenylalanyl-tRNA synthetase beta subunit